MRQAKQDITGMDEVVKKSFRRRIGEKMGVVSKNVTEVAISQSWLSTFLMHDLAIALSKSADMRCVVIQGSSEAYRLGDRWIRAHDALQIE